MRAQNQQFGIKCQGKGKIPEYYKKHLRSTQKKTIKLLNASILNPPKKKRESYIFLGTKISE